MCGIIGIIKWTGEPVWRAELQRLNDAIIHRGPDEEGYYIYANVGLAVRRLSIIDVQGGSQPITSQDGGHIIVFNGEIYNYREVRKKLQALGRTFRTNSDTEVVLEGYREWGPGVLEHLNGMWGFAIFDKAKKELFLSRDRLGKKQLYYAVNEKYLVFGSEMKIPMLFGDENCRLRLSALPEFLTYSYIGGPGTAVETIHLLPEAHWAKIRLDRPGEIQIEPYWDITPSIGAQNYLSQDEAAESMYELLVDAVRLRLVADVPISVMMSSGLDSSSGAYILAKELGAKLKTFSLGYGDADFDESRDAGDFARKLEMPWEGAAINGTDVANAFPDIIAHGDSLQANTAQIVYYFVNRMIHNDGFKVAINGSGGDELFAGYKTYQADTLFKGYRRLPGFAKTMLHRGTQLLPTTLGRVSTDYMLRKFTECPYSSPLKGHAYWRTIFSPHELGDLLLPTVWREALSFTRIYDSAFEQLGASTAGINNLLAADMKAWLIPMLPWVDNMSMAHSVELRLPFLDYRLVESALSLPPDYLFNGWTLKKLMKRFLKNRLPDEVLYRSKRGTHLPLSRWLNAEMSAVRDHYLSESVLNGDRLFNMTAVRRLADDHQSLKADNTFKIWNLMVFSAWREHNNVVVG